MIQYTGTYQGKHESDLHRDANQSDDACDGHCKDGGDCETAWTACCIYAETEDRDCRLGYASESFASQRWEKYFPG